MDYLQQAEKEIRENWFSNHTIKDAKGEEDFRQITWGAPGTGMYQVKYVLAGNMVFISGDLGVAAYALTCEATLDNIKKHNLSYFTSKLSASERDKYVFDSDLAQKQIEEYIIDWCEVDDTDQLDEEDSELFSDLITATTEWSTPEQFEMMGVYTAYNNTSATWFDGEAAECIARCGSKLSRSIISYWVGLQMIVELLEEQKATA